MRFLAPANAICCTRKITVSIFIRCTSPIPASRRRVNAVLGKLLAHGFKVHGVCAWCAVVLRYRKRQGVQAVLKMGAGTLYRPQRARGAVRV